MPYIGKSPVSGGFHKLGNLTASATATYALTLGGAAYFPETANQLLVSLNGVIQAPQDSFTVSGSNIVFASALTSSDSIDFIVALGDVLGVGSVSDGAITTAKIANNAVTKAKIGTTELDLATIKDATGTTTAMTIDSGGRILTPTRPAFRVYGTSSSWTNLVSNTKVSLLTTVDYNIGNHYSTTDYEFTTPCDGLFHFSGRLYVNNTATMSDFFLSVDDAAFTANLYFASQDNDQSDSSVTFAETLQLTAGKTVSIKGNAGQYLPIYSSFSGYLVG